MFRIPYTLKFTRVGEWAWQQSLFNLRDTYVAYGVRGLKKVPVFCHVPFSASYVQTLQDLLFLIFPFLFPSVFYCQFFYVDDN